MKKLILATAIMAAFAGPAFGEEEKGPHTLTTNMSVVSDYVFRGLTQTGGKPAIQGGFDYSHASGFYAGTWLSNVSWFVNQNAGAKNNAVALSSPGAVGAPYTANESNSGSLEWDIYGGYKGGFANDWTYDLGLIRYQYPGSYNNLGAYRNPGTTEVYGAIGYKWVTLKYSKGVSHYTFGVNEGKGADYLDLSATIPLADSGFNLLAHVGRQRYPTRPNVGYWGASGGDNSFFSYTDYKLGVTKDYAGFTFGLAWTYANAKDTAPDDNTTVYMNAFGKNIGRNRGVLSVSKTF